MRKLLIWVFAIGIFSTFKLDAAENLQSIIPQKSIDAELMTVETSSHIEDIKNKFVKTLKENPALAKEVAQNATPGKPLKYDKRFGLSEAEFNQLMDSMLDGSGIKISKAKDIKLEIKKINEHQYIISSNLDNTLLKGLDVNFDSLEMIIVSSKNNLGVASEFNNLTSPILPSAGYTWKQIDSKSGKKIQVTFSKLKNEKECLLTTDDKQMHASQNKLIKNEQTFIKYNCP